MIVYKMIQGINDGLIGQIDFFLVKMPILFSLRNILIKIKIYLLRYLLSYIFASVFLIKILVNSLWN